MIETFYSKRGINSGGNKVRLRRIRVGLMLVIMTVGIIFLLMQKINQVDDTFNNEINGKIFGIHEIKGHSWVMMENKPSNFIILDSSSFVLVNSSNYAYDCPELYNFLQIGDSIVKPKYTDSLFIYRNNQEYFFILGDLQLNKKK